MHITVIIRLWGIKQLCFSKCQSRTLTSDPPPCPRLPQSHEGSYFISLVWTNVEVHTDLVWTKYRDCSPQTHGYLLSPWICSPARWQKRCLQMLPTDRNAAEYECLWKYYNILKFQPLLKSCKLIPESLYIRIQKFGWRKCPRPRAVVSGRSFLPGFSNATDVSILWISTKVHLMEYIWLNCKMNCSFGRKRKCNIILI